jgi:hypothetical protein
VKQHTYYLEAGSFGEFLINTYVVSVTTSLTNLNATTSLTNL